MARALRIAATHLTAVGATALASWITWHVTSPGVITSTEFHVTLLVGAPCLIVALSAAWVGNGNPPADTRRER